MTENNLYEIRLRGKFMSNGPIIQAENPETAIQKLLGDKTGSAVAIEIKYKVQDRNWWLLSKPANEKYIGLIDKKSETFDPFDPTPQKRLIFAEICESKCQQYEQNTKEGVNLKFNNFENQLKKYEKEYIIAKEGSITTNELRKGQAWLKTQSCLKECAIAETAIIARETIKAKKAISAAEIFCQEAKIYAEMSHAPGDTISNSVDKAYISARKQFDKTAKKIEEFQNETIPTNKATTLGIN